MTSRFLTGFVLIALGCSGTFTLAQSTTVPDSKPKKTAPKTEPISEVRISEQAQKLGFDVKKLESIDRKFSQLVKEEKIVGCSAIILRQDEDVYFGKWGYQNRRQEIPVDRKTIFRIYSMTKPVVSVSAMQLVEAGKLDLDAPVSQYLPEFADLRVLEKKDGKSVEVPPRKKMTTRDLLRHTSGLSYGFFGNTEVDQRYRRAGVLMTDQNLKSTIDKLAKIPLLHHPATQFHYSASTDVLGRVIEVVSGQTLAQYMESNIFKPLEMTDTCFTVPSEKQDRFAQLYKPGNKSKLTPANPMQSFRFVDQNNEFFSGGGGLCSTVDDYCKFCQMLLNKGELSGKTVIQEETVRQMFTNQLVKIDRPPGRQFQFGLGFRISPQGDYGWGGAAGTRFWVNPEKQTAIIFMIQIMPYGNRKYGDIVRDTAYSALR